MHDDIKQEDIDFAWKTSSLSSELCLNQLFAIAKLFGVDNIDTSTARILEIKIAGNSNIGSFIFAKQNPEAQLTMITESREENKFMQQLIAKDKVTNVSCSEETIKNFCNKNKNQKFDVIVAPYVLSKIGDRHLEDFIHLIKTHSHDNTLLYMSHNTSPGNEYTSSFTSILRKYGTGQQDEPDKKLNNFIGIVKFLNKHPQDMQNQGHQDVVKNINNYIEKNINNPGHIFQNYLMPTRYYDFDKVGDITKKANLQYLSDVNLRSMFTDNLSPEMRKKVQEVKNMCVLQVFMDLITGRTNRMSIFCGNSISPNKHLTTESLKDDMQVINVLIPKNISDITDSPYPDNNTKEVELTIGGSGNTIPVSDPLLLNILFVLHKISKLMGVPFSIEELVQEFKKFIAPDQHESIMEKLKNMVILLITAGMLLLTIQKSDATSVVKKDRYGNKPHLSFLVRSQVGRSPIVTNDYGQNIMIDVASRFIIKSSDGTNSQDDIISSLCEHAKKGDIEFKDQENKVISDENLIKSDLTAIVKRVLKYLEINHIV